MKPAPLLRVAAVFMLLFAVGHTLGGMESWSPVGETDVLRAMGAFRFDAHGSSRTYLDFYRGFGWTISVFLALQAVLLWQLATLNKAHPKHARAMVAAILVASVVGAFLSWKFIFVIPVICFAVVAILLALAIYAVGR